MCNDEDEGNLELGDFGFGFGLKFGFLLILDVLWLKKKVLLKSYVDFLVVFVKLFILLN